MPYQFFGWRPRITTSTKYATSPGSTQASAQNSSSPLTERPDFPSDRVKLGPAVEEIAKQAAQLLAGTDSAVVAKYLQETYTPDETYGSAFGKLFARVFADYGLILVDPLDARLHRIAAPVYRKALADRATLNAKLLERDKCSEAAGFEPQVKVTPETTLMFQIRDGIRQADRLSR